MSTTTQQAIGNYWDKRNQAQSRPVLYWYQHIQALQHYRSQIVPLEGPNDRRKPIHAFLETRYEGRTFKRGLSVASGSGHKEQALIKHGIVEHFDLFDLSSEVQRQGRQAAEAAGIGDRTSFYTEDILDPEHQDHLASGYDLVHWDNSLHHMFDVSAALELSRALLNPGGVLVMDDYIGPTYMQANERQYSFADLIRSSLPKKYLRNNTPSADTIPVLDGTRSPRIAVDAFLRTDPSEMADAGNIPNAFDKWFPEGELKPCGGICYFLALRPLFGNFNPEHRDDRVLLGSLLRIDAAYNESHPVDAFHGFGYAEL